MSSFSNILVHIDSRNEQHPALEYAAEVAKNNNAKLKMVDVIPEFGWASRFFLGGYERMLEDLTQSKARDLKKLAEPIEQQGVEVEAKLLDGKTSIGIVREVLRDHHDLVIKAAKGTHSRRRGFFGTTATRLIRDCPCPVMILKPGSPCRCERVVAAISAAPEDDAHQQLNSEILELAWDVSVGGAPHVISVWSIYGESILRDHMQPDEFAALEKRTEHHAQKKLHELLVPLNIDFDAKNIHLFRGEPWAVIPQFVDAHEADLLVMGTVSRTGIAGMLIGNTAENILDRVECSLLAVKPAV